LKKTEEMKQNKLDIGAFTGNIDVLGEGGLPQTSSVSWCRSELVSGTLPVLSDAAYCFSLETCVAAENERDSARVQRVVLHETANIRILERMYVDGQWHEWKELLQKDGDLKDATVTFDSGDNESPAEWAEVAPVEGGEKQDSLWQKVSLFARNLRYLWKLCGTNDISGLADGTLTGAVSKLNTDLSGMENYSVNPVAIGKWIDGRNIYRQVYTGTAPTEPDGVISDHDAGYILINDFHNEIIDFAGYIQNIAGAKAPIKGYYIDQSDWLAVWHQAGAIRMRMPPNGYYVGGPFVLIVTYLQ